MEEENLNQPESVEQTPAAAPEQPKKFSFRKWPFVVIGILLLIILLMSGYFVMTKKTAVEPTPTPVAMKATPTLDPTAGWPTYNSSCGFSIKYPRSFNAESALFPDPNHQEQQCAAVTAKDIKIGLESIDGYYLGFSRFKIGDTLWSTGANNPVNSVQDYINQSVQNDQHMLSLMKQTPTTYGSIKGVQYDSPGIGNNKVFIFEKNGYIYNVGWDDKYTNETTKQIISSIKFTNSTDPTKVVDGFYSSVVSCWKENFNSAQTNKNTGLDCSNYSSYPALDKNLVSSFSKVIGADPVLCAQNFPMSYKTDEASVNGDSATTTVHTYYSEGDNLITVKLTKESGNWTITDIVCKKP